MHTQASSMRSDLLQEHNLQCAGFRSGQTYSCTDALLEPTYLSLLRIQILQSWIRLQRREQHPPSPRCGQMRVALMSIHSRARDSQEADLQARCCLSPEAIGDGRRRVDFGKGAVADDVFIGVERLHAGTHRSPRRGTLPRTRRWLRGPGGVGDLVARGSVPSGVARCG